MLLLLVFPEHRWISPHFAEVQQAPWDSGDDQYSPSSPQYSPSSLPNEEDSDSSEGYEPVDEVQELWGTFTELTFDMPHRVRQFVAQWLCGVQLPELQCLVAWDSERHSGPAYAAWNQMVLVLHYL